jgi:capsid assembly protease
MPDRTPQPPGTVSRTELLTALYSDPWAIRSEVLAAVTHQVRSAVEANTSIIRVAAAPGRSVARQGAVAVLPMHGIIRQRADAFMAFFGGTSTEHFGRLLGQVLGDAAVSSVVIEIDSPGGSVEGVAELGDLIYRSRGRKPIIAVANSLAASAAYWLGSQADELVVTPSGQLGSIGVFVVHEDISRALEREGVKPTIISAGRDKTLGNPFEPLSARARAHLQERVDDYYGMFVSAVARGRKTTAAAVRAGFGEGRVVGAREAVRLGMADRVATLDVVVSGQLTPRAAPRATAATVTPPAAAALPEPDYTIFGSVAVARTTGEGYGRQFGDPHRMAAYFRTPLHYVAPGSLNRDGRQIAGKCIQPLADHEDPVIYVDRGLTPREGMLTICHELGHMLRPKASEAECEAFGEGYLAGLAAITPYARIEQFWRGWR